jgi:hypothetical protein
MMDVSFHHFPQANARPNLKYPAVGGKKKCVENFLGITSLNARIGL